ncbi:ketopantoate reductase family protein [Rhodoligotrophos defluvii]|uniref:ketopantoate reductase family protein n=1 Tax=Rhodoligotrophos defluvii TaxID=2561934 RepID=UPI0010C9B8E9|nr:2-dehydropantoate 2-reductase [Rhodoligotrophos defluvii]
MKICIIGAGAIGVFLAARLGRLGHEIAVVARGERAAAIRDKGIVLSSADGHPIHQRPGVAERTEALGLQDYVLVTVKGYSVPETAEILELLVRAGTQVVFVQNGLPWWYFAGEGSSVGEMLDPGGRLAVAVPRDNTIGCVTYANVRNTGLGEAHHVSDSTFILGRPDGRQDAALKRLAAAMADAGIDARVTADIRKEVWTKLWGNLAFNPISALTGAAMDEIILSPETRPLVIAMMSEARAVAEQTGVRFDMTVEERLAKAALAGAFRTSMLQDLEAGRRLEIDAIIGAVAALARDVGMATPSIDVILGLIRQKAKVLRLA